MVEVAFICVLATYVARFMSVFSPRGVTPMSEFVCVLPFPDGDAKRHINIYPGSGKRRPYVQQGGESLYYFAPKCLYRGEYKRGME